MSNQYRIVCEVTRAGGTLEYTVDADDADEAEKLHAAGKSTCDYESVMHVYASDVISVELDDETASPASGATGEPERHGNG